MAEEVLSVKLGELEDMLNRLVNWIHLCEDTDRFALRQEIGDLTKTCANAAEGLESKLQQSRGEVAATLSGTYGEMQKLIQTTKEELDNLTAHQSLEDAAEEKALLAEYSLDFAVQAATRAVLFSMEAIEAQATAAAETEKEDNIYERSKTA